MIGRLEIQQLRREAADRLGPAFSLPVFHGVVLGHGSLPLVELRRTVDQWVLGARRPDLRRAPDAGGSLRCILALRVLVHDPEPRTGTERSEEDDGCADVDRPAGGEDGTSAITNCRDAHGGARLRPCHTGCPALRSWAGPRSWTSWRPRAPGCLGAAATVLVAGDAGIGKTRLVDEFCGRPGVAAHWWRPACASRSGSGLPYGPIVSIFRDLVRQSSERAQRSPRPDGVRVGSRPDWSGGAAEPAAARNVADELAKARFESVLACVTALAERSPIIVVVEDLRWADPRAQGCSASC